MSKETSSTTTPGRQGRHREVGSGGSRKGNTGPDVQKRRSRPPLRAEWAPYREAEVQAAEVDGAGFVEGLCSYSGRPRLPPALRKRGADLASATAPVVAEESAEAIVRTLEACGRRNPALVTREAFGVRKGRTSRYRETPGGPRGRR